MEHSDVAERHLLERMGHSAQGVEGLRPQDDYRAGRRLGDSGFLGLRSVADEHGFRILAA